MIIKLRIILEDGSRFEIWATDLNYYSATKTLTFSDRNGKVLQKENVKSVSWVNGEVEEMEI